MIEPTDEMVRAYYEAATAQARKVAKGRHPVIQEGTITRAGLAAVLAIVERDYLSVMADLVDTEPCWFDHHGGCQAHGFISLEPGEPCPHAQAKALLGLESSS